LDSDADIRVAIDGPVIWYNTDCSDLLRIDRPILRTKRELLRSEVLAYLRDTDALLRNELTRCRDILNRPVAGCWTVGQIASHLIRTERFLLPVWTVVPKLARWPGVIAALDASCSRFFRISGGRTLEVPDTPPARSNAEAGRFAAPVFLHSGKRPVVLESLLASRDSTRERSLRAILKADETLLNKLTWSHPLLGTYTLIEFAEFLGLHEEHHLPQIRRIREGANSAGTSA
jgi:hypothetical protein